MIQIHENRLMSLQARFKDYPLEQLERVIRDSETAGRADLDAGQKQLRAIWGIAAQAEKTRRERAQGVRFDFVQRQCRICAGLFLQVEAEQPLVYCEPCFHKAINATAQVSLAYRQAA